MGAGRGPLGGRLSGLPVGSDGGRPHRRRSSRRPGPSRRTLGGIHGARHRPRLGHPGRRPHDERHRGGRDPSCCRRGGPRPCAAHRLHGGPAARVQNVGAPQTIEQGGLYRGSVRWSLRPACRRGGAQHVAFAREPIVAEATWPGRSGPVHVNLAFGSRSSPGRIVGRPTSRKVPRPALACVAPVRRAPAAGQMDDLGPPVSSGRRGVIVAGAGCGEPCSCWPRRPSSAGRSWRTLDRVAAAPDGGGRGRGRRRRPLERRRLPGGSPARGGPPPRRALGVEGPRRLVRRNCRRRNRSRDDRPVLGLARPRS